METIEKRFPGQKAQMPEGVWQFEPDKMQWEDPATKLPCLIVRNQAGALCGYVGVPEGHPFYGKDYSDLPVECHGGLTFSDFCGEHEDGICHKPSPGEPEKVWWLGFDCGHGGDIIPSFIKLHEEMKKKDGFELKTFTGARGETYKDIAYVQNECRELAKQLKAAA